MKLETEEDISAYYRGALIQQTIELELRMEILIGRFLSMNNQDRVLDLIEIFDIAKIDFSSKMTIIIYIIKKHFQDFQNKKGSISEDRSKLFEKMEYVMTKRNILAHRRNLDNNEKLKLSWAKTAKKSIQKNELILDKQFINEFKEKCNECLLILIELEIEVTEWIKRSLDEKQT